MPVFIRSRIVSVRLARALRRSILTEHKFWEIDVDEHGCPLVAAGPFRVVLVPRAVRLLDAIHVYCGGAEVWMPLVWRLRLRNAVRLVIVEYALEMIDSAEMASTAKSVRKRAQEKQPA
jgi:hypothetical protein